LNRVRRRRKTLVRGKFVAAAESLLKRLSSGGEQHPLEEVGGALQFYGLAQRRNETPFISLHFPDPSAQQKTDSKRQNRRRRRQNAPEYHRPLRLKDFISIKP
jgi:hypothetical protein